MKLILIRHGESKGNVKRGYISGQSDPEGLTSKGRIQIIRTAWELRNKDVDELHISPVVRAQETGSILSHSLNVSSKTQDWLTELHHGMFEGYHWWEIIHKVPSSWRVAREDFETAYPGGGESMKALLHRVWAGLESFLQSAYLEKTYAFVSHQAVITAIRWCLLHGDPEKLQEQKQIDKFLNYMHSARLSNGGYVEYEIPKQGLPAREIAKEDAFSAAKRSDRSLSFYVRSVLKDRAVSLQKLQTASTTTESYKVQNGEQHILKIFTDEHSRALERQIVLYQYLHTHKIPSVEIEHVDRTHIFFNVDLLLQDYVEGVDQSTCFSKHAHAESQVLENIFAQLQKIHSFPLSEVEDFWYPPGGPEFREWLPFIIFNINFTLHHAQDWKDIDFSLLSEKLKKLREYAHKQEFELVPIHGDVSPNNIILTKKGNACGFERLIDFELARVGDSLWDFAYYWGWLDRENERSARQWEKILKGKFSASEFEILCLYRILFHAWTVRDVQDYEGDALRKERGERSRAVLNGLL